MNTALAGGDQKSRSPQPARIWQLCACDEAKIQALAQALNVSPIVAQLLLNRNITELEQAKRFLTSPLSGLYEPELLPGVPAAVERLFGAIAQKKRICVYGDYDVDGVAGTAILVSTLELLGGQVCYHIPHRLDEGYGLNGEALQRLASDGCAVVITVDCGIASVAEAEEARRLNLELIITDHHEPKSDLPRASAIVHPRVPAGVYACGCLSGAGVALKLAWALCKKHSGGPKVLPRCRELLLEAVNWAALGTVADVVPLMDENRILVRSSLGRLRETRCHGLRALLEVAGLDTKSKIDTRDIGFALAPRLNSAGRIDTARFAVELLTTSSAERARELARQLQEHNKTRQALEAEMLKEARTLADQCNGAPALILASAKWHPGLIGLVAGRLVETYGRPVLMIALRDGESIAAGSGRSVAGFCLHEALQECTEELLSHGGHAMAAGFRITQTGIEPFRQRFLECAARYFGTAPACPRLRIDAEVPLSELTPGLLQSVGQLEPYGAGNPPPVFLAGGLQVVGEPRRLGNGERHLAFVVRQGQTQLRAVAFGMADRQQELLAQAGKCCLVFTPKINEWQGRRSVELEVKDFQAGEQARLELA
jgi:single-stranded-DNA-specific exonuclease